MRRFYADSIPLTFDRKLLNLDRPDIEIVITSSVLKWVKSLAEKGEDWGLLRDLNHAIEQRTVEFVPVDFTEVMAARGVLGPQADLLGQAEFSAKRHPDDDVRVIAAASDEAFVDSAKRLGLRTITPKEVYELIEQLGRDQQVAALAEQEKLRRERRNDIIRGIAGVVLAALAGTIASHIEQVVSTISIWGAALAFAITGPLVYALRGRQRLVYGVAEVGVGYFAIGSAVLDVQTRNSRTKEALAILGGLYVVVRGLDNIGKALEKTPYESRWRRVSGEKKPA